jgi:hypothetical protein
MGAAAGLVGQQQLVPDPVQHGLWQRLLVKCHGATPLLPDASPTAPAALALREELAAKYVSTL